MATKQTTRTVVANKKAPAKRTRKAPATPKAKAPVKRTVKQSAPAPKPQPTRRTNRSQDEWDKVALEQIVPLLQAGTSMTDIRAQFGAGPTIRRALTRVGYDTKGRQFKLSSTKASNAKVLAKRVAERRQAGAAWWRLELETGKAADELRTILAKHGHTDLTAGRVITSERGKAKAAKQSS